MRTKLLFFLLIYLILFNRSYAAVYVFDYNVRCQSAYQQYMSLHLDEGSNTIRQELMANPYNLMATYLADYEDCMVLLFNGDSKDYQQRKGHLEERLQLIGKGNDRDPWFRLCKAGVYFHWALVHIRFSENLKAATMFRKSYLLLKENKRLFPDFIQNKVFLGTEEAVVGTIPDDYKWLASIFGMNGNVKKGVQQLTSFISATDNKDLLHYEAVIYSCYLRFYLLSQQQEVWNFVNSSQFPLHNNLFHGFVRANLALNFRKAEAAVQTLKGMQDDAAYKSFPVFDYEMGSALLHKLDDNAVGYLSKYLQRCRGSFFVKDAWQKMSWGYYLQQNSVKAKYCMEQIKKNGATQVDADKQAQRFAEAGVWPQLTILQARLLSDGGYYKEALTRLQSNDVQSFSSVSDKLEYYFRLGRVYDELGTDVKAVQYYESTIALGRMRKEHFAARAALQLGLLYEKAGRKTEAVKQYKDCLSMRGHDFQANIDQQAKAGINRLTQ